MNAKITTLENRVQKRLDGMLDRAKSMKAFLNTKVYTIYKLKQVQRWQTEGSSEGSGWHALSSGYAEYKRRRYAKYPYGGSRMLIATGRLFKAVVGPSQDHRKVVTNTMLSIGIATGGKFYYPIYVNDVRPFDVWSDRTLKEIKKVVVDYQKAAGI